MKQATLTMMMLLQMIDQCTFRWKAVRLHLCQCLRTVSVDVTLMSLRQLTMRSRDVSSTRTKCNLVKTPTMFLCSGGPIRCSFDESKWPHGTSPSYSRTSRVSRRSPVQAMWLPSS